MEAVITLKMLQKLFPSTKAEQLEKFVEPLKKHLPKYGINTKARIAHFLAQTGHESAHFKSMAENMNYSVDALRAVFKKYFTSTDPIKDKELASKAVEYARKPERIANYVYANRMGNGPESSGDGWKHRGVGLIQTTGKTNQTALAKALGMSVDDAIRYAQTPEGAVHSACVFWSENQLNRFADAGDVEGMTKCINGGTHGLQERGALTKSALLLLG